MLFRSASENAGILSVGPIRQAPRGLCALNTAVELPEKLSRRCIKSDDFLRRGVGVKYTVDNKRTRLKAARLSRVEGPCHLQLLHVGAIDLRERGIVILRQLAAIDRPVRLAGFMN